MPQSLLAKEKAFRSLDEEEDLKHIYKFQVKRDHVGMHIHSNRNMMVAKDTKTNKN